MNGFGMTERFVEIPWCLHRRGAAQVVLDIGYTHADTEYLQGLANIQIQDLYGLDIAPAKHITVSGPDGVTRPLLKPVQADVRQTPFSDDFFELIFCISTIEHIGMDNTNYQPGMEDAPSQCGDYDAIRELCRITRPQGRLLLSVPFGKYQNHGWFRQYDLDRLVRLAAASDYRLKEVNFFQYHNGWHECHAHVLKDTTYRSNGAPAAAGLACLELEKPAL
jgi:O-antigen chain-terminating methyltransferase